MCGILGAFNTDVSTEAFEKALSALAHRGPNASAIHKDEHIALGHRRLSILDLSEAGIQPMWSDDKRFAIVFNGEIYNYLELKKELESAYAFRTKTDTEVILAAYAAWGRASVERLNGMFAFAIWDAAKHELFIARDRLGEKPLFYAGHGNGFLFASEIKALLALGVPAKANERAVASYLYFGYYDHSEETFFDGIRMLPAGCTGTVGASGDIEISRYWDVQDGAGKHDYNVPQHELEETLRGLVADSIRLRFRSDVPVGVLLSSGLDSNTLLHYGRQVTGSDVEAFSLCVPLPEWSECPLIEPLLSGTQKEHWHTSTVDPEAIPKLALAMVRIQDQPFGGLPTIAYGELVRSAKERRVTVLLQGEAMDELLAGYRYYRDEGSGGEPQSQDTTREIHREILSPGLKAPAGGFAQLFSSPLQNAQYRDLCHTKLPRVLRFNDHASMAHSREVRMPYLDPRIVEFCFHLPAKHKIDGEVHKALMRAAFRDVLPAAARDRQKKAFGAWQSAWFRKYGKDYAYSILDSETFRKRPYWDHGKLREKTNRFFAGEGDNSFFLWQCINLELWLREYID